MESQLDCLSVCGESVGLLEESHLDWTRNGVPESCSLFTYSISSQHTVSAIFTYDLSIFLTKIVSLVLLVQWGHNIFVFVLKISRE